jgi:hypothetical protein
VTVPFALGRGIRSGDPAATRSRLADGREVACDRTAPDGRAVACDAELVAPPPPLLAGAHGIRDPLAFATAWTRAECSAKLHDVPMLVWLRRNGLEPAADVELETTVTGDVVVTVGLR